MTNSEKYKRAMNASQPSEKIVLEVDTMKTGTHHFGKAFIAVCAVMVLIVSMAAVSYAADIGGFRQTVTMWFRGEKRDVEVEEIEPGSFEWVDENGETMDMKGVVVEGDGESRPMTMDEMRDSFDTEATVDKDENGRIWLYYKDQKLDITDKLDKENIAKVTLDDNGKTIYFTVKIDPDDIESFNISTSEEGFGDLY